MLDCGIIEYSEWGGVYHKDPNPDSTLDHNEIQNIYIYMCSYVHIRVGFLQNFFQTSFILYWKIQYYITDYSY